MQSREVSPQAIPVSLTLIEPAALAAAIVAHGDLCIIDCRADLMNPAAGAEAFAQSHLPGAHFLDLSDDLSGTKTGTNGRHPLPERDVLTARLVSLGVTADTQVVAYDARDGRYAARLWWLLRWLGHSRVAVLNGGFDAWQNHGGLVEYSPARPVAAKSGSVPFTARPSLADTVDAQTLLDGLAPGAHRIVDARAPSRYRGENETIDAVGGHIPGALNRFFEDNLSADGRFKTPEVLRAEWQSILAVPGAGPSPETALVMQCGSGVTACHNLLALEIAGLPGAALYPGSWSEWSSDPARPVARGDASIAG